MAESPVISVVDDDETFRDSMRRLLDAHDFAVTVFASAAEFLASEELHVTACLVADVHMPAMTGPELYRRLVEAGRTIPTILVTAHPEDEVRERMLEMGVGCYLSKPLDEGLLIDCLRSAFSRSQGARR